MTFVVGLAAFILGMLFSEACRGDFNRQRRVPLDPAIGNRDLGDETDVRHQPNERHPSLRDDPPGVDWDAMDVGSSGASGGWPKLWTDSKGVPLQPVQPSAYASAVDKFLRSQGFTREAEHNS